MLVRTLVFAMTLVASTAAAEARAPVSAESIARTCATCHQPNNKAIPDLPGDMNESELLERLKALKSPDNTLMHRIVGGIDDQAMRALAKDLTGASS